MLKLELDLRSQFSFISYLACVRSCIYPRLGGELAEVPTIGGIQKTRGEGTKREGDEGEGEEAREKNNTNDSRRNTEIVRIQGRD